MDSMKIGEVIVDSKIGRISQAFSSLKTQWVSSFLSRGWLFYLIGFYSDELLFYPVYPRLLDFLVQPCQQEVTCI